MIQRAILHILVFNSDVSVFSEAEIDLPMKRPPVIFRSKWRNCRIILPDEGADFLRTANSWRICGNTGPKS